MPMVAAALFLGTEFSISSSMAALVFLTLKLWAEHFTSDDYGCRKLMLIVWLSYSSSTEHQVFVML
jgi:hypothetical protein